MIFLINYCRIIISGKAYLSLLLTCSCWLMDKTNREHKFVMRIQQFSERVAVKHVIKSTKAGQRDNRLAARSVKMSSLIIKNVGNIFKQIEAKHF
jgi:hypothetical protein